jgi:hypothetical protein
MYTCVIIRCAMKHPVTLLPPLYAGLTHVEAAQLSSLTATTDLSTVIHLVKLNIFSEILNFNYKFENVGLIRRSDEHLSLSHCNRR